MSETRADLSALHGAGAHFNSVANDLENLIQAIENAISSAHQSVTNHDLISALEAYLKVCRTAHAKVHLGVTRLSTFATATAQDLAQVDQQLASTIAHGFKL